MTIRHIDVPTAIDDTLKQWGSDQAQRGDAVLLLKDQWAVAAARVGMSEQTCYLWLTRSKAAQKINDTSSPFFFEWRDRQAFFHDHAKRARAENIVSIEALLRDNAKNGVEEICCDPATGRPLLALNPEFAHLTQQQFDALRDPLLDEPLDPKLRYLYHADGSPQLQRKVSRRAASLTQTAARATLHVPRSARASKGIQL
jgi:hypothetical protein